MRMTEKEYVHLLELVTPLISRKDTVMRPAISPHGRLTLTLRFLITGTAYGDLKFSACVSKPSISNIVPDTCRAILAVLQEEYLKVILYIAQLL